MNRRSADRRTETDMDAATEKLFFTVLWVEPIIAVTPWDYVWKRYVKAAGDPWRRRA